MSVNSQFFLSKCQFKEGFRNWRFLFFSGRTWENAESAESILRRTGQTCHGRRQDQGRSRKITGKAFQWRHAYFNDVTCILISSGVFYCRFNYFLIGSQKLQTDKIKTYFFWRILFVKLIFTIVFNSWMQSTKISNIAEK